MMALELLAASVVMMMQIGGCPLPKTDVAGPFPVRHQSGIYYNPLAVYGTQWLAVVQSLWSVARWLGMARLCSARLHPRWYVRCSGGLGVVLGSRADGVWRMAVLCWAVRQWKRNAARGMTFWSRRAGPSCIWSDTFIGSCKDG
ncbi:hypothetical protein F4803DRAFT_77532 [Xylaria telfairii]|nr:hypothetical protein F4803DRAFT_77532 [Xylaria telfairii]